MPWALNEHMEHGGVCLARVTTRHTTTTHEHFFGRGSLQPMAFSILAITALFGTALPDSYSLITAGCMLSCVASCFCVSPFAVRPFWMARRRSFETVACFSSSVSASSFAADIPVDVAELPPPPPPGFAGPRRPASGPAASSRR